MSDTGHRHVSLVCDQAVLLVRTNHRRHRAGGVRVWPNRDEVERPGAGWLPAAGT